MSVSTAIRTERLTSSTPVAAIVPFVPAILSVALWFVWIGASGGYFPSLWYPSAVGATVLLVMTLAWKRTLLPRRRSARVALLAFAGLVAINYLSILWSGSQGDALDSANKLLLYLAVAWLFAVLPWTPKSVAILLGTWSLGVAALCAVGLLRASAATHLDPFFDQFRYANPLKYPNGTAALAVMGMWPALILSGRRELRAPLRAVCLAVAVFLCDFAFLPQSRGALLGLIITVPLALIAAGDRLRLVTRFAVVGGALGISIPRTVALDDAINAGRHAAPPLAHAAAGIWLTTVAALALGLLLASVEDRVRLPRPVVRRAGWRPTRSAWIAIGAVLVIALSGASMAAAPTVRHFVRSVVRSGKTDASTGSTRIFSTSPEERFDYIRVGFHLFSGAPLLGVGAGDFSRRYDALKRFPKHSQYAHNLEVRTLSETGIVGFGLFAVVVGALSVGLVQAGREFGGLGRATAVGAFLVAAYFLIHASFDWLDEFPALAVPAMAMAMATLRMRDLRPSRDAAANGRSRGRISRRPITLAASVSAIVGAGALAFALYGPYLSGRYVQRALKTYGRRPSGAYDDISKAAALNPLSVAPPIAEGTVAEGLSNATRARAAFVRALRVQQNWYSWLQLGLLDGEAGRFTLALSEVNKAARLDVDDPLIGDARQLMLAHTQIDPLQFNRRMEQGANTSLFQPQNIK